MNKKYLTLFDKGTQRRFKHCGCDRGKIIRETETLSDIYTPKQISDMGENPNEVIDSKIICSNCKKELEEL